MSASGVLPLEWRPEWKRLGRQRWRHPQYGEVYRVPDGWWRFQNTDGLRLSGPYLTLRAALADLGVQYG